MSSTPSESLVIVPVATPLVLSTTSLPRGSLSVTVKVPSSSPSVVLKICTRIVASVTPGANLTLPLAAS